MAIFVVLSTDSGTDQSLEQAIKSQFEGNFYALDRGKWLVSAEGTSREVSDRIGVTGVEPPPIASTLVFKIAGYYGRASTEVWEWVATKLGGHLVG